MRDQHSRQALLTKQGVGSCGIQLETYPFCSVAAGVFVKGQWTESAEAPLVCKGTWAPVTPSVPLISDGPGEGFLPMSASASRAHTPAVSDLLVSWKEPKRIVPCVCVPAHGLPRLSNGKAHVDM